MPVAALETDPVNDVDPVVDAHADDQRHRHEIRKIEGEAEQAASAPRVQIDTHGPAALAASIGATRRYARSIEQDQHHEDRAPATTAR